MKWKGKINFETRPETNSDKIFSEGSGEINQLTNKVIPVTNDIVMVEDSEASWAKKKTAISNFGYPFGNGFENASSEAESSTTSQTWVNKLTHTTASILAGTYRIGYYAELRSVNVFYTKSVRLTLLASDSTSAVDVLCTREFRYDNYITNQWSGVAGFAYRTLTAVPYIIDIDYRCGEALSYTTYIRNARIEFWRVS